MDTLTLCAIIDHITGAVFDLVVPAILTWLVVWLREQWNRILLGRTIVQAAGAGYAAMLQAGVDGDAGIDLAMNRASDYVAAYRSPASRDVDRGIIAEMVRAELGALLACRPSPKPGVVTG